MDVEHILQNLNLLSGVGEMLRGWVADMWDKFVLMLIGGRVTGFAHLSPIDLASKDPHEKWKK